MKNKFFLLKKTIKYFCLLFFVILFGCKQSNNNDNLESLNSAEITDVLVFYRVVLPSDGSYDSQNEDTEEEFHFQTVVDDKFSWCYETQSIFKLEVLGFVPNASIIYKDKREERTINVLKNGIIDGAFSIVPSKLNGNLESGVIEIFSGNKLLKSIDIHHQSCM